MQSPSAVYDYFTAIFAIFAYNFALQETGHAPAQLIRYSPVPSPDAAAGRAIVRPGQGTTRGGISGRGSRPQAHQQLAFDARVSVHCWGGVLLRTMHVLALLYHPMASNHPGIICVMQPCNSPAALSFA